jgi:hypothetical protein
MSAEVPLWQIIFDILIVILTVSAIIISIQANNMTNEANQPQISIIPIYHHNESSNSNISEILISNDDSHNLYNFKANSFAYFNMSYTNKTTGETRKLLIPIYNYFGSPIYSYNSTGYLGTFTITNFKEGNSALYSAINQSFINYTRQHGIDYKLTGVTYLHLSYQGFARSQQDKYYRLTETVEEINNGDLPTNQISKISEYPVDFIRINKTDDFSKLFGMWMNESQNIVDNTIPIMFRK